ncbi:MAG: S9 family peptidase [Chloroflexota bacterium]
MAKRRITISDLENIKLVADPNISPDGKRVAFVVTRPEIKANQYRSAIWMLDLDAPESPYQFTSGTAQDFSPRWSNDGRYLAFISNRDGDNQLYVMPSDGGEPWNVTSADGPVSDIVWLPDDYGLLFVAKVNKDEDDDEKSDVRVIRNRRHKLDGEGFFDGRRRHIHRVPVDGGTTKQITRGDWDSTQPAVARDGKSLAFVSNRSENRDESTWSDVWVADLSGGEPTRVTAADGVYSQPRWSADGSRLAFIGHPVVEPYGPTTLDDIYLWDRDSGEMQSVLSGLDREPGNSAMSDCRFHLPSHGPTWKPDGDGLLTLVSDSGAVNVYEASATDSPQPVVSGQRDIQSFTVSGDGTMVFAAASMTTPTEIFVVYPDGRERQLSNMNDAWLEEVNVAGIEQIRYESDPGVEVHGWVLHPPGFNPDARYPAIVQVHGGPHGMYGVGFFHEMQVLAARGYVVLMTNPRGSTGYGQEWVAGTLGDWGGKDYRDVVSGVEALEALSYVDPGRIGITGGSYGGYMTNWAIGQTDRFKAAVSQRSTANRISLYGTSDMNWSYNDWEYGGSPYDNEAFYRERSPLTYVKQVETPVLLLHSENDLRCPISQSEEFFTALRTLGKTVEFVRFPDESHGLSRSGQPKHRVERLERICNWFDRYL